jgi:uncharacterized FAD-dependent dehydrogenase
MSLYARDNRWANAAVVAGVNLDKIMQRSVSASEAIDWLEKLESDYFQFAKGYSAPAQTITSFLEKDKIKKLAKSSYPFPLIDSDLKELLPASLIMPLKEGLKQFCAKLNGYDQGIILGLESKTSSPIQVIRDPEKFNSGYENLFLAGEGSGRAGGIISSAADGIKIAQRILIEVGQ